MSATAKEIRALDYIRRPETVAAYLGIPVAAVRKARGTTKPCTVCGAPFHQRLDERPNAFARRGCCSTSCAGKVGSAQSVIAKRGIVAREAGL